MKHFARAAAILSVVAVGFFCHDPLHAETGTFTQESWAGGASHTVATHGSDQTGWAKYSSKSNVDAGSSLSLGQVGGVVQVSAGGRPDNDDSNSCLLTSDGSVYCWGRGILGDGTQTGSVIPVRVHAGQAAPEDVASEDETDYLSNIAQISVGHRHACAVSNAGNLYCWGSDSSGRLGDGGTDDQYEPVRVHAGEASGEDATNDETPYLTNVAQVSASAQSCAVSNAGKVYCWGKGNEGRLGNGLSDDQYEPVQVLAGEAASVEGDYETVGEGEGAVSYLANVASVETGDGISCATSGEGRLYCWGRGGSGQTGNGDWSSQSAPVRVRAGEAASVEGDYETVGEGEGAVSYLANVVGVSGGGWHVCAVSGSGALYCWGEGNHGKLGNGSSGSYAEPVRALAGAANPADTETIGEGEEAVSYLANVVAVGTGRQHTCAQSGGGAVYCWGSGDMGKLGDGSDVGGDTNENDQNEPVQVLSGDDAAGNGDTYGDSPYLGNVAQLTVGLNFACTVSGSGNVYCWGNNRATQLGIGGSGDYSSAPVALIVPDATSYLSASAISAGDKHACALVDGAVYCWGKDNYGQLGNGETSDHGDLKPTRVLAGEAVEADTNDGYLANVTGIYSGPSANSTCAKTDSGNVYCWGDGGSLQLGNGGSDSSSVPVRVLGGATGDEFLTGVQSIAVGDRVACAIKGGALYCWGRDWNGDLGNGGDPESPVPVRVVAGEAAGGDLANVDGTDYLAAVSAVAVGDNFACATTESGKAYCWGYGGTSQLGNGDTSTHDAPVRVVAGDATGEDLENVEGTDYLANVGTISVGFENVCVASATGGRAYCWGWNSHQTLGDGTWSNRSAPVRVLAGQASLREGDYETVGEGEGTNYLVNVGGFALANTHSCAWTESGMTYCWGRGDMGKLGNGYVLAGDSGSENDQAAPVLVISGSSLQDDNANNLGDGSYLGSVNRMVTGRNFTCALAADNHAYCWGSNEDRQLASENFLGNSYSPTHVIVDYSRTAFVDYHGLTGEGYALSGTLYSSIFDTGSSESKLASIDWDVSAPEDTGVSVSLRSSADASSWSSWQPVDLGSIVGSLAEAGANRFFQYRVALQSSSREVTPELAGVAVSYDLNETPVEESAPAPVATPRHSGRRHVESPSDGSSGSSAGGSSSDGSSGSSRSRTSGGSASGTSSGRSDTRTLQVFLNAHGHVVAPDGPGSPGNETDTFGKLTREALAKFQAEHGIEPASGFYGPLTRALVESMLGDAAAGATPAGVPAPAATPGTVRDLEAGSQGDDVGKLQGILIAAGYPIPAGVTGYFGSITKAALAKWQADHGIAPATGYFGPRTRAAMTAAGVAGTWW